MAISGAITPKYGLGSGESKPMERTSDQVAEGHRRRRIERMHEARELRDKLYGDTW